MLQQVIREFPPQQLALKGLYRGQASGLRVVQAQPLESLPDLPWSDFAEVQMRREP
jgi:hypothetical protein